MSNQRTKLTIKYPDLEKILKDMYLNQMKSCHSIGKELGANAMTIHKYLKQFNIPRRDFNEAAKLVDRSGVNNGMYGKRFSDQFKKDQSDRMKKVIADRGQHWCTGKTLSNDHKNKISASITGDKNPRWNGGKRSKEGYIEIYNTTHPYRNKKRNTVYEHRIVMEKHLGRYLSHDEHVHHINGNKSDNRIENLRLLSSSDHAKLHGSKRVKHKITYNCSPDKWEKTKYKSCLKCSTTTIMHRGHGLCAKCYVQEKRANRISYWKEGGFNAN